MKVKKAFTHNKENFQVCCRLSAVHSVLLNTQLKVLNTLALSSNTPGALNTLGLLNSTPGLTSQQILKYRNNSWINFDSNNDHNVTHPYTTLTPLTRALFAAFLSNLAQDENCLMVLFGVLLIFLKPSLFFIAIKIIKVGWAFEYIGIVLKYPRGFEYVRGSEFLSRSSKSIDTKTSVE